MKVLGIIVAAGEGKRFGSKIPKQFHLISGIPVIARTLTVFEKSDLIHGVIVVCSNKFKKKTKEIIKKFGIKKVFKIVNGGRTRQDSVYNGLISAGEEWEIVLVHDGVRPFVTEEIIVKVVNEAIHYGAAIPGIRPLDTVKIKKDDGNVETTVERDRTVLIQTPQAFRQEILREAHIEARRQKYTGTDDAELVERIGKQVRVVDGDYRNIKITTNYDIVLANAIIKFFN